MVSETNLENIIKSETLIIRGKYCISLTLKIVSTKIELSKYIQLIIHLGNIVAITKKNKKIYSIFLDIKKIMQFMIIELYLYCWFTNYNDKRIS